MNIQFFIKRWMSVLFILLVSFSLNIPVARAQSPVVHAVLFFSPSCGNCKKVMSEDLPPLTKKYGDQLKILQIDVTNPEGQRLFRVAVDHYQLTEVGVPTLVVGDTALVGSLEIPQKFPGIIETNLAQGGIGWPDIPGLSQVLASVDATAAAQTGVSTSEQTPAPVSSSVSTTATGDNPDQSTSPLFIQKFRRDPLANSIAVVVLAGMIMSIIYLGYSFLRIPGMDDEVTETRNRRVWIIPLLCIIGLGVAAYLSYVEISHAEAVCGPVGNCNTVNQSRYATLFGFLPVGVFGMLGYLGILAAWLAHHFGPSSWKSLTSLVMWGMAVIGVLFSIYLTFLEPFVIGATCAWCITSAIVITLILWTTTGPAIQASTQLAEQEDN